MRKLGMLVAACGLPVLPHSVKAEGFVEDSRLTLLNRTYYFNRDYRDQPNNAGRNRSKPKAARNGYREELTQGLQARFSSGYTPGTFGLGLDAHAMLGLKLDSGGGRTGTGNLPVGTDGHPDDHYGKAGGALKLRHGATQLKYGQMTTTAPVFAASSNRTLPGMGYGLLAESRSIDGWLLEAGHFIATLEKRQGLKVACLEEIAYRACWITAEAVEAQAQPMLKNGYGQYLMKMLKETVY